MHRRLATSLTLLILGAVVVLPFSALAQDRTPIRRVLDNPPALVRAEEGLEGAVDAVEALWPTSAPKIASSIGLENPASLEIVLLHGSTFQNWSRGLLPEWGVGFANWPGGPIAIDMERTTRGNRPFVQILEHELSHVYLGQRLRGIRPPTWFVEGMAQRQSGEWTLSDTAALVQAASVGALPRLSLLAGRFPAGGRPAELAYRVSLQAVQEIDRQLVEQGGVIRLVDAVASGERFDIAFSRLMRMRIDAFEVRLEDKLRGRYGWMAAFASAGTMFTAMTLLFLAGGLRTRLRSRRRLKEMEQEEQLLENGQIL